MLEKFFMALFVALFIVNIVIPVGILIAAIFLFTGKDEDED